MIVSEFLDEINYSKYRVNFTVFLDRATLGISPNFEITVACGVNFHWYLRKDLKCSFLPFEVLNLRSSNTQKSVDFTHT